MLLNAPFDGFSKMDNRFLTLFILVLSAIDTDCSAQLTSLSDLSVKFKKADGHLVELSRGDIKAIIVDNSAIDLSRLPNHRAGYSGVAKLTHAKQPRNLFVPGIAGLNFEHIHDGTTNGLKEKFEPRKFPMQLRIIDEFTVELYQPPTGNWKLESCGRYRLLKDGTIEYSFECRPRELKYKNDFIGLFWASYIHQPEDKAIFFYGRKAGSKDTVRLIKGITPKHGVQSTHRPKGGSRLPSIDANFPLTLVNHPSSFEYDQPWYYGVSRKMAVVQMFRPHDKIWLAQSPSGGGNGIPAWDFQWFIRQPKLDQTYGFVMRLAYLPFESHEQIKKQTQMHREVLARQFDAETRGP